MYFSRPVLDSIKEDKKKAAGDKQTTPVDQESTQDPKPTQPPVPQNYVDRLHNNFWDRMSVVDKATQEQARRNNPDKSKAQGEKGRSEQRQKAEQAARTIVDALALARDAYGLTTFGNDAHGLKNKQTERDAKVDAEYQKAQAEHEAAKKAYSEWLAKSYSDEWLYRTSVSPEYGGATQEEIDAFNALQQPLLDELKRTSDAMKAAYAKTPEGKYDFFNLDLLQKGAFDDGYQAGDVTKTVLGTAGDVGLNAFKGLARLGEGLGDAVTYGIADIAELTGNKENANTWRTNADKDFVGSNLAPFEEWLDQYSILGNTTTSAAEGVGQMAGIWAAGTLFAGAGLSAKAVSALTKILMGTSSYGHGVSEARNSGATDAEARCFGLLNAGAEILGESLFSTMGKSAMASGTDVGMLNLDDLLAKRLGSLFSSPAWKNAAQGFVKALGNGTEEGVTSFLQAVAKKITYMKEEDLWDIVNDENLWEQFFVGALTAVPTQAIDVYNANKSGRDLITGLSDGEAATADKNGKLTATPSNTPQSTPSPTQDTAAWLDTIVPKAGQVNTTTPTDTDAQKNAVSEETTNNVQNSVLRTPTYEELTAKPDMNVVSIGVNKDGKSYAELKTDVLQKAHQEGWLDRPHMNMDTGLPIFVTEQSFTHAFSNLTKDFGTDTILAMGNVPDIIREAVLVNVNPPKNPRKAESRVLTFFAAIEGESGIEPVKLTVKEYAGRNLADLPKRILNYFRKNGGETTYNTLYDAKALEVLSIEKAEKEFGASASVADSKTQSGAKGTPNSTIRVADLLSLVKGKSEKYIPTQNINPSVGNANQSVDDYLASIVPPPANSAATSPVDTGTQTNYNNTTTSQGGNINADGLLQNDRTGSSGDPAQGLAGVQPRNTTDPNRGRQPNQVAVDAGVLRISDELQAAQSKRGTQVYPVYDTTSDPASYEDALIAGRESDTANGWCVTPKSAKELAEGHVRTFMNADHTVGVGVAPDGDIVAVFKNKNGGPQKAMDTAIPIAIEQGGDRLDCYGEGLVRVYARYGFIPVARVEFNAEYANEGWTPEKGTPYIYVMMHNGDSASTVTENIGNYPKYTQEQLDALPTYGKEAYDDAMAYRNSLIEQQKASTEVTPPSGPTPSLGVSNANPLGTGEANIAWNTPSQFGPEVKRSKLYSNTYANTGDPAVRNVGEHAKELNPDIDLYEATTEKESLHNAALRTSTDEAISAEYEALMAKERWTGEDNDTAEIVLEKLLDQQDDDRFNALAHKQRTLFSEGGQFIQSAAKYTRTNAAKAMAEQLDGLTPGSVNRKHYQKQGFAAWKKDVSSTAFELISQVKNVQSGDVETMKQIIRSIARFRKTTAWLGYSSKLTKAAERVLNKLDFDTAKEIALRQVSQIPGDFHKRSKGEVAKSIRVHNMLSSFLTVERNLGGNSALGIMDALADSTVGLGLDALISKVTGRRTVGFDIKYASEYLKAAKEGLDMAALCVELDIPLQTESKYEGTATRTHSTQGGPITRFFSAFEKYLKYGLEVTDKFYEKGTYASVEKSLQALGEKSNLDQAQISAISQKVANRRTFKDNGALADTAKTLRKAGNALTRSVSPDFGVGDLVLPFAGVGSNVAQTGIDYTAGTLKGAGEIFKIIIDAKQGKAIDPGRQRKAVTDAARGITGIGLISMFAALAAKGIIRAEDDDDKDRRAAEQSVGLSGAQFNVSAALRALQGKSTDWQETDVVFTVDFLEPFNTQMYMGYMLTQEESLSPKNVGNAAVQSIMASILDSPLMQGLTDIVDLAENFTEAESLDDVALSLGEYGGEIATSYIPGFVRQIAHTVDPYYRDTSGDTPLEAAWNQVRAQVPWASNSLPTKFGMDGQPLRRYEDSPKGTFLGVRNNLLNPVTATTLGDMTLANALGALSDRTGNVTIYPEKQAPKSFSANGQTILVSGKKMTETYQGTYMGHINSIYNGLLNDPVFGSLPDSLKVKSLEYAKQYATEQAKASISDFSLTGWVASAGNDPASAILDKVAVSSVTDALNGITSAWENGENANTAALDSTWAAFQAMPEKTRLRIIEEQGGRVGAYLSARQAGVSAETFTDLYNTYWELNNSKASAAEKAESWGATLDKAKEQNTITSTQRNVLWDSLGYWTQIRQNAEKYNALVDGGLSANQSTSLLDALDQIVPKPGNVNPSAAQKFEVIIDFPGLTPEQEDAALREYMTDAQEGKYDAVLDMGFTAQDYIDAYNAIQNESGTGKKARVIAKFQSEFDLSYAAAKKLYEIYIKP